MKDLISDSISKKLSATMESLGGASAIFGDPVTLDGQEVIPVARVVVKLGAAAEGAGSGDAGSGSAFKQLAKGGGGGNADASVSISIEPAGFVHQGTDGPRFTAI